MNSIHFSTKNCHTLLNFVLSSLLVASVSHQLAAQTIAVNSPSFDFVQRVNYGSSRVFEANSENFSSHALGDGSNSAQQTWFRVKTAVEKAAAGREIRSATLTFRNGTEDRAARTLYLARTSLGITSAVNRRTIDGSAAYPSAPGSSASFSSSGYLSKPLTIAIDATGAGSVDVTDWVKNHVADTWFLTASPAARGAGVSAVKGANWGSGWHWVNRLTLDGGTTSPVQLVLQLAMPADSPPLLTTSLAKRAAHYAGEPFSLGITAATGKAPLAYQWKKDGKEIPGATSSNLTFSSLSLADRGIYQVVVSNINGRVISESCDLTVVGVPDLASFTPPVGDKTRYHAQGNAVIGFNQGRFFNRPHYTANTNAFILTGDKPLVKFASGGTVHGHFLVGMKRGSTTKWLHDFSNIAAAFQPAHTTWQVTDPSFPGLSLRLQVLTLGERTGFTARAIARGARDGDQLVWAYGGASQPGGKLNWSIDPYPIGDEALRRASFNPESARGNVAQAHDGPLAGAFTVALAGGSQPTFGRVSVGRTGAADAVAWASPDSLSASKAKDHPMIVGNIPLSNKRPAHWSFTRQDQAPVTLGADTEPALLFSNALARSADFASRLFLDTPDPRVNAAAAMAVAGVDGMWYGEKFVHGSMSWNSPYLGWRTTIGGTMLGWPDRVKTSVDTYLATQITESNKTSAESMGMNAGKDYRLTKPSENSRFYGKGYVVGDQTFYEMQTQYFDQILQDWRWRLTDDPAHEAKLRKGVELHLERFQECYDPDENGTYESVINTWPTDSIWFNGGGCADATGYAYRAHEFARDLAKRAKDEASEAHHRARLDKIKSGFFKELWVSEAGHPGLFREQGGHQRLVNNPWLYSHCVPIEAGMLTPEQAATTLHNTEYNLENIHMESGGRRVVTSNFTPSIWSVRVLWPGDNFMLAHAYFRTGLARDGWDVLRGSILHTGFNDLVPGDSVDLVGGTDFGDTTHTFTRTLVEGLFGYQPDYPFGKVLVAPQFPADWENASIKNPDVSIDYQRRSNIHTLDVRLQRDASLTVEIPVRASGIKGVTVDGTSADYETRAGFGQTIVRVTMPTTAGVSSRIAVSTADLLAESKPVDVKGVTGNDVTLAFPGESNIKLISFSDPLGALEKPIIESNAIIGKLSKNLGHRRVFATVKIGDLQQIRIFNLHLLPDPNLPATTLAEVPAGATWKPLDIASVLTADITQIYEQKYLSPRPQTVSSRIGDDGYSPWTFPHWGVGRPTIAIDKVPSLLDPLDPTRLITPQGVPFKWGGSNNHVAFASLWDNWPDQVSVPVNQSGDAAWFLICGSTTVMQGRIANAVLRLKYADGVEETLELIPPYNYWNLSPIKGIQARAQFGSSYYDEAGEAFTVPKPWPMNVELGTNCRAMVLNRKLRPGMILESVTLEALSQESVIGLMGVTIQD
jgi:hypothetical protein